MYNSVTNLQLSYYSSLLMFTCIVLLVITYVNCQIDLLKMCPTFWGGVEVA